MTLTEFLLARIAEREVAARAVGFTEIPMMRGGCRGIGCQAMRGDPHTLACPAQVLADCEAKRRIVELHARLDSEWPTERLLRDPGTPIEMFQADALAEVLRLLARPHSDHPDYDPKWKP